MRPRIVARAISSSTEKVSVLPNSSMGLLHLILVRSYMEPTGGDCGGLGRSPLVSHRISVICDVHRRWLMPAVAKSSLTVDGRSIEATRAVIQTVL